MQIQILLCLLFASSISMANDVPVVFSVSDVTQVVTSFSTKFCNAETVASVREQIGDINTTISDVDNDKLSNSELTDLESLKSTLEILTDRLDSLSQTEMVLAVLNAPEGLSFTDGVITTSLGGHVEIQNIGNSSTSFRFTGTDICSHITEEELDELPSVSKRSVISLLNSLENI